MGVHLLWPVHRIEKTDFESSKAGLSAFARYTRGTPFVYVVDA
jgi:hypothetical protein